MKTVNELSNMAYAIRGKKIKKEVKKIEKEIERYAKDGKLNIIWRNDYFDKGEASYIMNLFEARDFEVEKIADLYCIKWG